MTNLSEFSPAIREYLKREKLYSENPVFLKINAGNDFEGYSLKMLNGESKSVTWDMKKKNILTRKGTPTAPILFSPVIADNLLLVLEGETDALAISTIYNGGIIAMSGANVNKNQIAYIGSVVRDLSTRICLLLDTDAPGRSGAIKAMSLLKQEFPDNPILNIDISKLDSTIKDVREGIIKGTITSENLISLINDTTAVKMIDPLDLIGDTDYAKLDLPYDYHAPTETMYAAMLSKNGEPLICTSRNGKIDLLEGKTPDFLSRNSKSYVEGIRGDLFKMLLKTTPVLLGLFNLINELINRYVFLRRKSDYEILTLYILMTYCYPLFKRVPYLLIKGPPGSGKTTLSKLMADLSFNGEILSNPSFASVRRLLHSNRGTMVLDDTETLHSDSEFAQQMRSVLNSGYEVKAVSSVCLGSENIPTVLRIGGPKIINNIIGLEPTLLSRCILIETNYAPESFKVNEYDESLRSEIRTKLFHFFFKNHGQVSELMKCIEYKCSREHEIFYPLKVLSGLINGMESGLDDKFNSLALENQSLTKNNLGIDDLVIMSTYELYESKAKSENFQPSNQEIFDVIVTSDFAPLKFRRNDVLGVLKRNDLLIGKPKRNIESHSKLTFYQLNLPLLESKAERLKKMMSIDQDISNT